MWSTSLTFHSCLYPRFRVLQFGAAFFSLAFSVPPAVFLWRLGFAACNTTLLCYCSLSGLYITLLCVAWLNTSGRIVRGHGSVYSNRPVYVVITCRTIYSLVCTITASLVARTCVHCMHTINCQIYCKRFQHTLRFWRNINISTSTVQANRSPRYFVNCFWLNSISKSSAADTYSTRSNITFESEVVSGSFQRLAEIDR